MDNIDLKMKYHLYLMKRLFANIDDIIDSGEVMSFKEWQKSLEGSCCGT